MDVLSGRRVVVTGADGFIGSHLAEYLVRCGADVTAMCLYNSNGSAGWLDESPEEIRSNLEIVLGDIRDHGFIFDLVRPGDVVFHLAALIAIPYSYLAPSSFVETNIGGTLNVLEAARRRGDVTVINTSTSEVYGTPHTTPIIENHPLQAQSPYAATKVGADQMCKAYAASYGVDVRILRPFNTFGPRQSLRAVIPTIISQLLSGSPTLRLGSIHPRRDFTYVADTVEGFVKMSIAEVEPGSVVQLGTGASVSVGEIVDLCQGFLGTNAEVLVEDRRIRPEASEVQVLLSDPTNAAGMIGWLPATPLLDGLVKTADWMRTRLHLLEPGRYYR